MFGRRFLAVAIILSACFVGGFSTPVAACPMCKQANESEQSAEQNLKPKAYFYSILFMLAMPATLFTGFSIGFYRLSKKNGLPQLPDDEPQVEAGSERPSGSRTDE